VRRPAVTGTLRRQLAALLRREIKEGGLKRGAPPPVTLLCLEHGRSRQACGKALRVPEREKLVRRVPGPGYYMT
jgi:DNA-binding GntR family transcriptional regulator